MRFLIAGVFASTVASFVAGPCRADTPQDPARYRVIGNSRNYFVGSFIGYMSPFNKGSLREGADYAQTMTVDTKSFPNNTIFKWSWPFGYRGIRGFDAIGWGNLNFGFPRIPVVPSRVAGIKSLVAVHSLTIGGFMPGFDVIYDMFLTSKAGDSRTKLFEIEIALHMPAYGKAYFDSKPKVASGLYVDPGGKTWHVSRDNAAPNGQDLLFYPIGQADLLAGSIDMLDMMKWLVRNDALTGNEYFNGLGIGAEPQQGSGFLKVDSFHVDYSR